MTRLVAEQVSVRRDGRAIVDAVSATFEGGAFVAVIGANGAGKSTLLAALAGLLAPDAGSVTLDGTLVSRLKPRELARRRAYLPQNPRVEWPIAVERLVALGLTPHLPAFGGLAGGLEPRLSRALADCDLLERRLQPATTLSGGELARAMLARALVGDPQVLVVDEPIAGLDPRHALDTVARLRALAGDGRLVVAALHDLTLTARFATHALALRAGQLAAYGPVAEVLTSALIRDVFEVEARVSGLGAEAVVDLLRPA